MGRVVDFHAHYLPRCVRSEPRSGTAVARDGGGLPVISSPKGRTVMSSTRYWEEPAARVERMASAGVDVQVLSVVPALYRYDLDAPTAASACRDVNDETAALVSAWPQAFAGFAALPLQDTDAAVQELERAVGTLGLVGASVGTHVNGEDWDAPRLLPVLEAAEALEALVFVHPVAPRVRGMLDRYHLANTIGNPFETTVAVASLVFGGVLDRVPDVTLLFAHGGGFSYANAGRFDHAYRSRADASAHARQLPSAYLRGLYFDCITHGGASLRHLLDVAGSGQVVLGTDDPADMGVERPEAWLAATEDVGADERRAVLRDNAAALLARTRAGRAATAGPVTERDEASEGVR